MVVSTMATVLLLVVVLSLPVRVEHAPTAVLKAVVSRDADICTMPVDIGKCSRTLIRYYYDPVDDECKQFKYSGCGGNANRFMRRTNCKSRCVKKIEERTERFSSTSVKRLLKPDRIYSEPKIRRTLESPPSRLRTMTTTTVTSKALPAEEQTVIPGVSGCPQCDPLYGSCLNNKCGCIDGFRALGNICIDVDECRTGSVCPANSRCVNTVGSFRCECDFGFSDDGQCVIRKEACDDMFDVRYTEEDCSDGLQELRYYYDREANICRQFLYGGCVDKSKNIFPDPETCENLCAGGRKFIPLDASLNLSDGSSIGPNQGSAQLPYASISATTAIVTSTSASIVMSANPQAKCAKVFDEVLRLECMDASWVERFFWNTEKQECEPFWYDGSCDPEAVQEKNFFEFLDSCQNACSARSVITTVQTSPNPISNERQKIYVTESTPLQEVYSVSTIGPFSLRRTYSPDDPFGLMEPRKDVELTSVVTHAAIAVHRHEVSNFEAKTPTQTFDRVKYIEEFRKKLNSFPKGYKKPVKSWVPTSVTISTPHITAKAYGIEKFDKHKFAEEFRKKLMAFPEGYITKAKVDFSKSLESTTPSLANSPLSPDIAPIQTPIVDDAGTNSSSLEEGRAAWPREQNVHALTSTAALSMKSENKSAQHMLGNFTRLKDLCDELLDPKLEEDCSNENWELKWFFNSERGACKSFWYGGCETNARNFFGDVKSCRTTCGHRMFMQKDTPHPHNYNRPSMLPPIVSPSSSMPVSPVVSEVSLSSTNAASAATTSDVSAELERQIVGIPSIVSSGVTDGNDTSTIGTNQTNTSGDICDEGYDPKWDEDCSDDNWVIRAYFDPEKKGCKRIWWGGCETNNKNLWMNMEECRKGCRHMINSVSKPFPWTTTFRVTSSTELSSNLSLSRTSRTAAATTVTASAEDEAIESATSGFRHYRAEARAISNERVFQADLERQLASIKRHHENREDLAYSKLVNHPVTIASECLEPFDINLTKSCDDGKEWTSRYYFDRDLRVCRMYWHGGCFSSSRNDFANQESCMWRCMGQHTEPASKACLDPFDWVYHEDCRHGEFSDRYYFNHERKECKSFQWGGCQSPSQNFFATLDRCKELCESLPQEFAQSCLEPFDDGYRGSCSSDGRFKEYYYFDHLTSTCQMFWFGNCPGSSHNIYPTLGFCQWICERHRDERKPTYCSDKFDPTYRHSCGDGHWVEKAFFDHETGRCNTFWWDGCISTSQNIFNDLRTCQKLCEDQGYEYPGKLPDSDTSYRCLLQLAIGTCKETYPAYYFDRPTRSCRPFSYSGCGGNENRFLTLSQCENLCEPFMHMTESEMDCHMPLENGIGSSDSNCLPDAGFRFYFSRSQGKCLRFWYQGCGGNANNFYSYEVCQRTCEIQMQRVDRKPRANSNVCFQPPGDKGNCPGNDNHTVQRWTYSAELRCVQFTYSGCGGGVNRFATRHDCEEICNVKKPSKNAALCSYDPEWGSCNQLRYMWFYNQSSGRCDQFLYGGCGGNPNKFDTFEICQQTCELTGIDPCMEPLDRGSWCEAMSNRYYFNKRTRQCKGFHYTGCGKSGNNFVTKEECQGKCEKRYPRDVGSTSTAVPAKRKGNTKKTLKLQNANSRSKSTEKAAMLRHIILDGDRKYHKTEPEWLHYALCVGYRYNVSGQNTVLNVHFCADGTNSGCTSESYDNTNGEEFCNVQRPFLRGTHLYTWYFSIDIKAASHTLLDRNSEQRNNESATTILLLKPNHCHDIC